MGLTFEQSIGGFLGNCCGIELKTLNDSARMADAGIGFIISLRCFVMRI